MAKKDGMYCYYDWIKPLERVPAEDFKELFISMLKYSRDGEEPPEFDGITGMAADFIFPQIARSKMYAENGKKGGESTQSKTNGSTNGSTLIHKPIPIPQTDTETNTDTSPPTPSKGEARTREKRFKPPNVDEVRTYCAERKNGIDPRRFVDYYTANGWKVGKSPMKDWKAAVRNWENNSRDKPLEQTHADEEWDEFYELAVKRGLGEVG